MQISTQTFKTIIRLRAHSVAQTIVSAIVYAIIDAVLHEVLLSVVSNYGKQCMFSTSGEDTKYNMANSWDILLQSHCKEFSNIPQVEFVYAA